MASSMEGGENHGGKNKNVCGSKESVCSKSI